MPRWGTGWVFSCAGLGGMDWTSDIRPVIGITICGIFAAILWFLVATRFGRKRITIRALLALIVLEAVVFWQFTLQQHVVLPF